MDFDELFPGRFLKSGEFKGKDVHLTIKGIRLEDLPQEKGGTRVRGIISFHETPKELVLNRTNGESIKAMFGRNTDDWIDKSVTFYPAPHVDSFTGEKGTAIRVRGSRDIPRDVRFDLRLPRRRPIPMVMKAIPRKGNGAQRPRSEPPPPEEEPMVDEFGDPIFEESA